MSVVTSYQPTTKANVWTSSRTIKPGGLVLHSTAWPGKNAQGIRDYFNAPNRGASIHAAVDDKEIIQCLPWTKRAGHVGGSFNNSHIGVEMCEPTGLTYNKNGSAIISYNPPAGYFRKVWDNAVALFAELCETYGLDPLGKNVIVSHAEAHALGAGDNHADTAHWFKWENKTMDDFRQAVYEKMKGDDEDMDVNRFKELWYEMRSELQDNDASEYSAEARQWAVDTGLFVGTDVDADGQPDYMWEDIMTREQLVTVLHRFAQMMERKHDDPAE